MSRRERKATDRAGRHPRMGPNLSSADSQNPGANAAGKKQKTTTTTQNNIIKNPQTNQPAGLLEGCVHPQETS